MTYDVAKCGKLPIGLELRMGTNAHTGFLPTEMEGGNDRGIEGDPCHGLDRVVRCDWQTPFPLGAACPPFALS